MDCRISRIEQQFIPIPFSNPLSFGKQTVLSLDRLRISMVVENRQTGIIETGWGEVPLNFPWFWPQCPYDDPTGIIEFIVNELCSLWTACASVQHPLLTGYQVQTECLENIHKSILQTCNDVPFLAVQVINSAFDIALYDGFAKLNSVQVYDLFDDQMLSVPLENFFAGNDSIRNMMKGVSLNKLLRRAPDLLGIWHMVGILDPVLSTADNIGLEEWIRQGGITRLKIKLSGDPDADFKRLEEIRPVAHSSGISQFSLDYNGPGEDLSWLSSFLDRIKTDLPFFYKNLCYIEQPVMAGHYGNPGDVKNITGRIPLLVDEGAGNWQELYEYYRAGWSGVALKICKSQTSSLLMFALSRVLNKKVTVMDLTNPSLAQIAHVQLAAHLSDDAELESNGIQYCPLASLRESEIHPGLFSRNGGCLDRSSLKGPGYGYRISEMYANTYTEQLRNTECF